jgi:hypothetical protein
MPPPSHVIICINYQTAFRTKESTDVHGGEQTIDEILLVEESPLSIDISPFNDAGNGIYRFFCRRQN